MSKFDATIIYKIRRTNIHTLKPSIDGGPDKEILHIDENSEAYIGSSQDMLDIIYITSFCSSLKEETIETRGNHFGYWFSEKIALYVCA